jgi:hypothetical protein
MSAQERDRFGNPLDPAVGYARGQVLSSAAAETARHRHGSSLIRARVARHGAASIGIFTGNRRDFLLRPEDVSSLAEEWVGAPLFAPALDAAIRAHLQAPADAATAVFNRGSAALVAAICALAPGGRVVSMAPAGARSHPSVRRGAALAGARFEEVQDLAALDAALRSPAQLLVVTPVTSSLARMAEAILAEVAARGRRAGLPVLFDDAYGARLRPILHGGAPAFAHGADLVITNADKAGLHGPRAGIRSPRAALVTGGAAAARKAPRPRHGACLAEGAGFDVAIHYARQQRRGRGDGAGHPRPGPPRRDALQADLGQEAEVARLVPAAQAALGPLGVLVNNASTFERDEWHDATRESWDRHMEPNLRAPFVLAQAFARALPKGPRAWWSTCSTSASGR